MRLQQDYRIRLSLSLDVYKRQDINRTSIYYKESPVSDDELACKEIIDHLHTDNPTWGARQMSAPVSYTHLCF